MNLEGLLPRTVQASLLSKMAYFSLNLLPNFILEELLQHFYFEEKVTYRCVCRSWNVILGPDLVKFQAGYTAQPSFKGYGKFISKWDCGTEYLTGLAFAHTFFPNIKELSLRIRSLPIRLNSAFTRHIEFFTQKRVRFCLEINGWNLFLINAVPCYSFRLTDLLRVELPGFSEITEQPFLKELDIRSHIEKEEDLNQIIQLISQKFKALEILRIELYFSVSLDIDIFSKLKGLKSLTMKISHYSSSLSTPIIPAETDMTSLTLDNETFLNMKKSHVRLKSVKRLSLLCVKGAIEGLNAMFPNLYYLYIEHNWGYTEKVFSYPVGAKRLDFKTHGHVIATVSSETYPSVVTTLVQFKVLNEIPETLAWIFKHLVNLETLFLDTSDDDNENIIALHLMKNTNISSSLKKFRSRIRFPLQFIRDFMALTPNLEYISLPLDQQSKEFLDTYPGLYIEAMPALCTSYNLDPTIVFA
ncbi:hypothetical protein DSO57_1030667 [Entomophthora muscae]|uniref:Uncharacterized protein n=1 Tax=Entomophthora muscae TaxID=34485 RepID=A0ACC2ULK7_9FUNG|nr:hypothetical protein DSO57_1030667 [Entomophthora muscae]